MAPSWRAKTLQNRGQNATKSMLKNKVFSASNFGGIGLRFGRVFGRLFRSKMHANSETKKSVRQAKNTVKTNTKLMPALVQRSIFRTQIHDKSHVFGDIDFGRFLEGFWKGFGRRKSFIFAVFSMLFRSKIRKRVSDSQRIAKSVSLGGGGWLQPANNSPAPGHGEG